MGWSLFSGYTITLNINVTTLLIFCLIIAWPAFYFVRYYVLVRYMRSGSASMSADSAAQKKAAEEDQLGSASISQSSAAGSDAFNHKRFLPEEIFASFLSSIKIFNYLDRSVLVEFARNSQQKKLYAGEYLQGYGFVKSANHQQDGLNNIGSGSDIEQQEQSGNLYLVMDGCVQLILSPQTSDSALYDSNEDLEHLVLNKVTTGGTISSLFDVLSVYANNVLSEHPQNASVSAQSDTSSTPGGVDSSGTKSRKNVQQIDNESALAVRALTDTTLLVIPPEAFLRVSTIYPNAISQIIQIILTRFQRVSMLVLGRWLGVGMELVKMESSVYGGPATFAHDFGNSLSTSPHQSAQKDLWQLLRVASNKLLLQKMARYVHAGPDEEDDEIQHDGAEYNETASRNNNDTTSNVSYSDDEDHLLAEAEDDYFNTASYNTVHSSDDVKRSPFMTSTGGNPKSFALKAVPPSRANNHRRSKSVHVGDLGRQNKLDDALGNNELLKPDVDIGSMDDLQIGMGPSLNEKELNDVIFDQMGVMLGLNMSWLPASSGGNALSSGGVRSKRDSFSSASNSVPRRPLDGLINHKASASRDFNPSSPQVSSQLSHLVQSVKAQDEIHSPASSLVSLSTNISEYSHDLQILYFEQGATVIKQGDVNVGLYFVIEGLLEISMDKHNQFLRRSASYHTARGSGMLAFTPKGQQYGHQQDGFSGDKVFANISGKKYYVHSGGMAGYLASLTSHASLVNVVAAAGSYVAYLPKESLESIVERAPQIMMMLSKRLCSSLTPLVRHIDLALEWIQVNAGKVLYKQDDPKSDCIYIVLNGRLRALREVNGQAQNVNEFSLGESVGETEVLTNSPRVHTVTAIRDTELARMPHTLFNALAIKHPNITLQISRMIASKSRLAQSKLENSLDGLAPANVNYKTVALVPTFADVPIVDFAERLRESLIGIGETCTFLDSSTVTSALGRHAFSRLGKLKLLTWLTEQEEKVRLVLYVADTGPHSPWTQRCIRQADVILVVTTRFQTPEIGDFEKMLLSVKTTARKELVILHPDRQIPIGLTKKYLGKRPWLHTHHHLQIPMLVNRAMSSIKIKNAIIEDLKNQFEKITSLYTKYSYQRSFAPKSCGPRNDFARLARRLVGKSIGIALGGGGSRGIAHIGIIHAFEEAGIPIDMIGGVSIGALIGGLYSLNEDIYYVYWRAGDFGSRVNSVWRQILDLTYPLTSWFSGNEFNRAIWKCFGDQQIEDSWLSYFCCTTNITHSKLEIHTSGFFWRFVRASMSLSGYLPPLCDNNNMLLDGGYLNNLPGDILRANGADTVIAVDVGSDEQAMVANYGDALSGWYALLCRLNPFNKTNFPSLTDIQSRLAYVSCVKQLEDVKNMPNCIYLRPPVGHFGTLEFNKFDQIYEIGYKYGKDILKEWESKGLFSQWKDSHNRPRARVRRNSI
ncbi:hypothetical protein MIR68_005323 [Amoeboaphelidium protococcarum]|nr:hypothetical protein MIR68_005323 [Amoeboaphelidium protococcarum]